MSEIPQPSPRSVCPARDRLVAAIPATSQGRRLGRLLQPPRAAEVAA